jgi:hypothetical protein
MPSPVVFDVESYFDEFASSSAMAEASRFKTIPTGSYTAQVSKREGRYFEEKDSKNGGKYWSAVFSDSAEVNPSWRKGVQVTADVSNAEGKKLSTIRIEASWEDRRDAKGRLDQLFTRWDQLTRAMFPGLKSKDGEQKSTGEVLTALSQYPIKVYVTESFKVPAIDGSTKWKTAENEEVAKEYRAAGYEVRNFVQSVGKV